jgi:hypothetical protein
LLLALHPAGNILQFRFFLRNDAGLLVALFWLFACALSSFAYFVSVFLAKQQSAVYTGFVVFLVSYMLLLLLLTRSSLIMCCFCHTADAKCMPFMQLLAQHVASEPLWLLCN